MPNLLAVAADRARRRPATDVQAQAPIPVGPKYQLPTTATNLFAATVGTRALAAYESSSSVYSIVMRRASDVARIPWALYRNTPGQTATNQIADDRQEIPDHAFLRVWRRPNPLDKTSRAFWQLQMMYLDIMGEACTVVGSWGPGRLAQPAELWVCRPDRLTPIPDPRFGLAGWIHMSEDGERTPLRTDQVIQIKYPNPRDPLRGLGPVTAAMLEIDASVLSTEWFRNFYLNNAQPGGIVATEENLSRPEFDEWVERWNEQFGGGPQNAHRVALMDKDTKWMGAQMSMLDMQFAELINSNRDAVRETFGMSKVILGQTGDVNRAASIAQQDIYARYTLMDRVDLIAEMANVELLPRFGSAAVPPGAPPKFVLEPAENIIPVDVEIENQERDSRVNSAVQIIDRGGDPAETLEAFGLPPITMRATAPADGGDSAGGGAVGDGEESEGSPLGAVDGVDPMAMARLLQMLYLSTPGKTVVSTDEARRIARKAGADLDLEIPDEVLDAVAAVLSAGGAPPADDDDQDEEEPGPPTPAAEQEEEPAQPPAVAAHHHGHKERVARIVAAIRNEVMDPVDDLDDDDDPDAPLDALQDAYLLALESLTADYVEIEEAVKDDIVRQLDQLLTSHGLEGLDQLAVNMGPVADRLVDAMERIADAAADELIATAEQDGFRIEPPVIARERLQQAANGVAQILGNRLSTSAKGAVLRAWSGDNEA